MSSINGRIAYLLKTVGEESPTRFGELIGASPQYVAKISKEGGSVGIEPVTKILRALPELNARWLILGEGDPFDRTDKEERISADIDARLRHLVRLERYIPAMSVEELDALGESLRTGELPKFEDRIRDWERVIQEKESAALARVREAIKEGTVCKTKQAKQ